MEEEEQSTAVAVASTTTTEVRPRYLSRRARLAWSTTAQFAEFRWKPALFFFSLTVIGIVGGAVWSGGQLLSAIPTLLTPVLAMNVAGFLLLFLQTFIWRVPREMQAEVEVKLAAVQDRLAYYERASALEIRFEKGLPPYQEDEHPDFYGYVRHYRIGIRNAGSEPVTIRATLVGCEPALPRGGGVGRRLRHLGGGFDGFLVPASEHPTEFVEVLREEVRGGRDKRRWYLCTESPAGQPVEVEKGDYSLTIELTGGRSSKIVSLYVSAVELSHFMIVSLEPVIPLAQREREFEELLIAAQREVNQRDEHAEVMAELEARFEAPPGKSGSTERGQN